MKICFHFLNKQKKKPTRKWLILISSDSMSRISSISTSIASDLKKIDKINIQSLLIDHTIVKFVWIFTLTGGSNSFWSSSYNHISTAKRFRIKLIWCDPYFAVRNFSRRSLTASPFSVKFTRKLVLLGDLSQSFSDCKLHCILLISWTLFRGIMNDV